MPAVIIKGAIVATVVVAGVAIAIYQSPEARQFAEDCRRRIAMALHSLGDGIHSPDNREPRFNRPEDAEGFMRSGAEAGVDADEESRRRQREELMYWNRLRLEKLERERERQEAESGEQKKNQGVDFDDFLHEDTSAEKGTYVYHSGSDAYGTSNEGLTRRRAQGVRGLNHETIFENPFADENCVEMEEQHAAEAHLMSPDRSEVSEDIYTADDIKPSRQSTATLTGNDPLVDVSEPAEAPQAASPLYSASREPEMVMADTQTPESAYASIQAWADNSHHASFYSPLPTTPQAPLSETSEPSLVSGQATPTDSASLAGSAVDIGRDNTSSIGEEGRFYDFMSEDGEGIPTPGSWTEVGSVVSESDAGHHP